MYMENSSLLVDSKKSEQKNQLFFMETNFLYCRAITNKKIDFIVNMYNSTQKLVNLFGKTFFVTENLTGRLNSVNTTLDS